MCVCITGKHFFTWEPEINLDETGNPLRIIVYLNIKNDHPPEIVSVFKNDFLFPLRSGIYFRMPRDIYSIIPLCLDQLTSASVCCVYECCMTTKVITQLSAWVCLNESDLCCITVCVITRPNLTM